jgi:glycosyltransferase involved in cell wall biosynthesis
MAVGCPIVASRTPPVQEVIDHGEQGLLFDFFSRSELIDAVERQIDQREAALEMGRRARQRVVERFDLYTRCLPLQRALVLGTKASAVCWGGRVAAAAG